MRSGYSLFASMFCSFPFRLSLMWFGLLGSGIVAVPPIQAQTLPGFVSLSGNVRPELTADRDLGLANDELPMHLFVVLRRSSSQQADLVRLIESQQQAGSVDYERWLTPAEFDSRFGPAPSDLARLTKWLAAEGFILNAIPDNPSILEVSGTAGIVDKALHTRVHVWNISGATFAANVSNPQIPVEFESFIAGITGLNQISIEPQTNPAGAAMQAEWIKSIIPKPRVQSLSCDGLSTDEFFGALTAIIDTRNSDVIAVGCSAPDLTHTDSDIRMLEELLMQAATQGQVIIDASGTTSTSALQDLFHRSASPKATYASSIVASATVKPAAVPPPPPATPVISPLGSSAAPYGPVTMTDSTPGALIYYEVNGGTPTRYTGPIQLTVSETIQAVAVSLGSGGTYALSPVNTQVYNLPAPVNPTWTQVFTLPTLFTSQGGTIVNAGDANLYGLSVARSSPHLVNSVYIAPQSNMAAWANITTASLSQNATEYPTAMGSTPSGTVFLAESNGAGISDVYYWNGSTTSPVWKKVTGWTASSASGIYNFTNDSAGYTYFSPAWSGDIWRNDAPNSTNFTRIQSNLYGLTGSGAYGGLYQTWIWNLNDGKGDQLWACGEGGVINVDLGFKSVTQYLSGPGYTGNCFGLGKSTNSILGLRNADSNGDSLSRISIGTRTTSIVPSSDPISPPRYPSYMDTNNVGGLQWISGTSWMLNNDAHGINYLLLSTDDGSTWKDITASGGINASCQGTNLGRGANVAGHYIYARCQGGRVYWQFGPI